MTAADAEDRLRYVRDVRRRAQQASLGPIVLVGMLGALVIVRGLLMLCWPHAAGLSGAWFLSVSVLGLIAALWLEDRQRTQTGVTPAHRGRLLVLAVTLAVDFAAQASGLNVIIPAIAVPLAFAEGRAGARTTAAVIATIAVISEALVQQGTRQWAALLIFGAGLVAVSIVGRPTLRSTT